MHIFQTIRESIFTPDPSGGISVYRNFCDYRHDPDRGMVASLFPRIIADVMVHLFLP